MKIIVYSHDSSLYGAPHAVFELTQVLQTKNEVIYVIPRKGQFESILQKNNYKYKILSNPSWLISPKTRKYSDYNYIKHYIKTLIAFVVSYISAYAQNIKFIKSINPDLIFVNTCVAPLGLHIAKRLKIRSIIWIHESICSDHGWSVPSIFPKFIVKKTLDMADVILGPSDFIKKHIETTFGINRLQIFPNIINYQPSLIEIPHYTFGLVGSLSERKGQYEFAEAMIEYMPEATLIIYGTGNKNYEHKIKKLLEKYPQRIIMSGYEANLDKIYSSFDIYINMGVDETFGRTTIEAMRAGKLVFGRNSGATPELIQHGNNGFLFNNVDEIFTILNMYNSIEKSSTINAIKEQAREFSLNYTASNIIKNFKICLN